MGTQSSIEIVRYYIIHGVFPKVNDKKLHATYILRVENSTESSGGIKMRCESMARDEEDGRLHDDVKNKSTRG